MAWIQPVTLGPWIGVGGELAPFGRGGCELAIAATKDDCAPGPRARRAVVGTGLTTP